MAEIYKIGSDDIIDKVSEFGGTNLLGGTALVEAPSLLVTSAAFTYGLVAGYNSPITAFTLEEYDNSSNMLVLSETATGNRGAGWCTKPGAISAGETYTFSCLLKPSISVSVHVHEGWRNGSATATYAGWTKIGAKTISANVWTKYVFTFQPSSSAQLDWEYLIGMCFTGNANGVTCYFAHPKLEQGNKPTDWTPAPADLVTVSGTELQFF